GHHSKCMQFRWKLGLTARAPPPRPKTQMQFLEVSGDGLKLLICQTGGTVSSSHLSVC
ncbi:Hypothetical predicted protein, partial [Marmota monax]